MENIKFERAIVDLLVELIESRDLKHDAVAKAAWPGRGAAGRTWQAIRNDSPPQKLTLRDAYGLAKELNLSMSALCGIIEGRAIEEAMKQQAIEAPQKNEAKAKQEAQELDQAGSAHAFDAGKAKTDRANMDTRS